jgi:hypothetical protein
VEECQEILAIADREIIQGIGDDVIGLAVRGDEAQRHAVRPGGRRAIRDHRIAGAIGETHQQRQRCLELRCARQPCRFRRRGEAAVVDRALGVGGAEARMRAEDGVHLVDDADGQRILGLGRHAEQQGGAEDGRAKRDAHAAMPSMKAPKLPPPRRRRAEHSARGRCPFRPEPCCLGSVPERGNAYSAACFQRRA